MEDLEFQVKRVRISLEASTNSTQEIDNETDIGRSIMTNSHNVINFPFAVDIQESIDHISISRHAHKGRFHDPPTSSAEKDYQEYFRQHCIPLTGTLMVHDTHLIPILDRNVGQLAFFALKIFRIQPTLEKTKEEITYYRTARAILKYNNLGWQWFITLLQRTPEELGWRETEISYNNNSDCVKLLKWLGHGRTAQVFEGIVSKGQHVGHRVAVKIARNSMCKKIKEEVDILMILKEIDVMDWGYAVNINLSLPFAGGLDCASDLVLESVRDRREIVYQKSDDLISLLR
ncbi:14077_t:CDS:2, partial [Funneliformis mosseae]